jgi:hypothetical protein
MKIESQTGADNGVIYGEGEDVALVTDGTVVCKFTNANLTLSIQESSPG